MKRIAVFLSLLLLILASAGCASVRDAAPPVASVSTYRDIPGVTEEEISAIEALKSVRGEFSYGLLLSTEAFILPDGSYAGFAANFCELLSGLFGIRFVPRMYEWDALMDGLDSRSIDFTGELTPTEERMHAYCMTLPIAERMLRIFVPADSNSIQTESDLNGLKIGFLAGSVTADSIRKSYSLSFTSVETEDYRAAAMMIENGEIDAFVDEAVADPAFERYGFIRSEIFFPMVHESVSMTTSNPELLPVVSVVNKYIGAGGVDKLYELYKDGDFEYAKYKLKKSFTEEETSYIDDLTRRGEAVSVAFERDNYPVIFYNETEGEFEGIAVDVLNEISRLADIKFESAAAKDETWADMLERMGAGDIRMAAQLLYTDARKDSYIWSAVPYARSYYALMSRSDHPNLTAYQVDWRSVGVMRQSGKADIYRELFPNNKELREYDTHNDCLDALGSGEIELLMASEYMLLNETNYRERSGLKINIKLNVPMDSYFGFHRDEKILSSIIDKAQQYVQTDVIETSWTGRTFDYSKKLAEQRTLYLAVFAGALSLILAATAFLLVRNERLSGQLKEIANTDALTGVFNRRFFMELSEMQIERSSRTGIDCFIIIFDLDHFKLVNDTYGHPAGDKVLKDIAQRVKKSIRPYDLLGRYGGEEFIILMSDVKEINKLNVMSAAERIRLDICKTPVEYEGKQISVSASFGIAYSAPRNDIVTATRYADEALYRAKKEGRNRTVFYDDIVD